MKRIVLCIFYSLMFLLIGCRGTTFIENKLSSSPSISEYEVNMKRDVLSLMMAYPEFIYTVEKDNKGNVFLIMKSGRKILYDDRQNKSFQQKLDNPDVQDMMEQVYPLSDIKDVMPKEFNPGRVRVYSLLQEVYGSSRAEIEKKLKNVQVGYGTYPFNSSNKANESLKLAMTELMPISEGNQKVRGSTLPASGTYNYRVIAGTNRLSPHSFGIAVDLARDKRDYWKWATREQGQQRLDSYPREIVNAFENNNFIWGGKWGYFDILHFEYRPEIIIKGKYFGEKPSLGEEWYKGLDNITEEIKAYINIIDSII